MRTAVLLLLCMFALAGEPDASKETRPITTNMENVGPKKAAQMLRKAGGVRVEFAPQLATRRINLRLIGVPTVTAMNNVAEAFRGEVRFLGKKRWRVAPAWQFELLDKLEGTASPSPKIDRQPIGDILAALGKGAGIDIVLDKAADRSVRVSVPAKKRRSHRRLLDAVVKKAKLKWELRYGVVYVASPKRLKELPVLVPVLESRTLLARRLDLDLQAVPLEDVGAKLDLKLAVPDALRDRKITITTRATDITLPQALALMLYPEGLTAVETGKDGALEVRPLP